MRGVENMSCSKKKCKYYPCHDMDHIDCTFCNCPIYPCNNEQLGGKWIEHQTLKELVWDCSKCTIIHDVNVVWIVKRYINQIVEIWKKK